MPVWLPRISNPRTAVLSAASVSAAPPGAWTTGAWTPTSFTPGVDTVAPAYAVVSPQTLTVSPGAAWFTPCWIVVEAGAWLLQLAGEAWPSESTMIVAPNAAAAVSASVAPTVTGTV